MPNFHLPPNHNLPPHTRTQLSHYPPNNTTLLPPTHTSTRRVRNFCSIVLPTYSPQSSIHTDLTAARTLSSVNPQPWHFTNSSLGLSHAYSLSVYQFFESVSCVYLFFSTSLSICVSRAACLVFCSIFIIIFFKDPRIHPYWCTVT